jgi:hypothetical protein
MCVYADVEYKPPAGRPDSTPVGRAPEADLMLCVVPMFEWFVISEEALSAFSVENISAR